MSFVGANLFRSHAQLSHKSSLSIFTLNEIKKSLFDYKEIENEINIDDISRFFTFYYLLNISFIS